jgi:ferredoxin/flavodoxin---NADP+ reductase
VTAPNAVLIARLDLNERLWIARILPDDPLPPFEPGQFVQLGLPDEAGRVDARAYSIASTAHVPKDLEFLLERVEGGRLTPRLHHLAPGGRLWLSPTPLGTFTLDRISPDRDLAFVATGTGLAPFVSMLRTFLGTARWRRCVLIHGARTTSDLAWRNELEAAQHEHPTLLYLPTLTREPEDSSWTGERGRVQHLLEPDTWRTHVGAELTPDHWTLLLCGNPDMIRDVRATLETRGFTLDTRRHPGTIRTERYW